MLFYVLLAVMVNGRVGVQRDRQRVSVGGDSRSHAGARLQHPRRRLVLLAGG
jgi:hypothetical protein